MILNNNDLGPFTPINGQIEISGEASTTDTLTVDFSAGNFPDNINIDFDGGNGNATLVLQGGTFNSENIFSSTQFNGNVTIGTATVVFSNLNTLDSLSNITNLEYDFTSNQHLINVVDGSVGGVPTTEINDTGFNDNGTNEFVTVDVANATNVLINGTEGDEVTLNNPNPGNGLKSLTVDTGAGNATVNVLQTPATVQTSVTNTTFGDDVVNVGGASPSVPDGIEGPLHIDNPAGFTTLVIDDSGDTNPEKNVMISNSQVTGFSPGVISYAG